MANSPVLWIASTAKESWKTMPSPVLEAGKRDVSEEVRIDPGKTFQTVDGFGGCFNELGWVALQKASPADRKQVMAALFGDDGCAFTLARLPIGASDFALDGYSLDDSPGDLALKDFSIERDRKNLIPFAKAAMAVRPTLKCWGSAWSPPAWMKDNRSYSRGSLRWEPEILRSYAIYLARWVDAYRGEGFNIYAITPQNEPNIVNIYPTTLWTGPQLREFVGDYLGPTLRDRGTNVELWLGINGDPPNNGKDPKDRLAAVMASPAANPFITGIAFQYDSRNQIRTAHELYPDKKLMQSETECFNGDNSWAQGQRLYGQMRRYFEAGANAYFLWNMVLDETGMSTWKWRQNSPITVHREGGMVTYHAEYFVARHFSRYVKPGARRVETSGPRQDKIAFVNPDGSVVLVIGNSLQRPYDVAIELGGSLHKGGLKINLPAESISTIVVAGSEILNR